MENKLLSVCMIVKNEEKMLAACLESLGHCASEVIVVDTGSTDSSRAIARDHGAKVIDATWNDSFAEARNIALDNAHGQWILCIDADERLLNPEELVWALQNASETIHGFLVNLSSTATQDGVSSRFVSQLLRVFRNDKRIRFSGSIHEQVIECFAPNGLMFVQSDISIEHLGYNLSSDKMYEKQMRNLKLLDATLRRNPQDAYMLQQRAKTYLALRKLHEAEKDTNEALFYADPKGTVRPQALNYGAIIAFQLQDYATAISRAQESLRLVAHQAFASFTLGECYTALQDYPRALDAYLETEKSLERDDVLARIVGAYHVAEEQLAYCIGRCYMALCDQSKAERNFEKGLQANKHDVPCRIGLANCAMNSREFAKAKILLQEAQSLAPERNDIAGFIARLKEVEAQAIPQPATQSVHEKPLISLCMIVKNEEKTLRTCLESVQGVVDEIVIVDTGSTDNTLIIAQEFGARLGSFEWIGDFAKARNEALKLCSGEWILYLDADEMLTEESASNLRSTLTSMPQQVGGLICTIVSPHRQEDDESEVHRGGYPRIFRNYGYPRVEFRGRVHEQITPSLLECGAHIVQADLTIIHSGYDIDRDQMELKVKRNYTLLIKHVQEEPLNAYAWFQLGQTLGRMKMNDKAEEALQFALDLGTLSTPVAASAASTVAHICGTAQRYDEALKWSNYSLEKIPHQVMALNYKAYALMYLNRYDEAERTFKHVLDLIENKSSTPEAGYDVDLHPSVVYAGLKKIEEMRTTRSSPIFAV